MMTTEQLRALYTQAVANERAWCRMPRTMQEEKEDVAFLRSIESQRLHVPAPPAAIATLIESVEQELDESRRSAHTRRPSRTPGAFAPRSIREDSPAVGATPSAGTDMTLPDDWTKESNGAFRHAQDGALHLHQNGTWTHLKGGRIAKRGTGQQSLTEYVKTLATGNEGPAGTSVEAAEGDVHHRLRAALLGEPAPVPLQEGAHAQLARALGHDGHILQESDKDTAVVNSENIHARLARALRGY